jgi:hypothetical protein
MRPDRGRINKSFRFLPFFTTNRDAMKKIIIPMEENENLPPPDMDASRTRLYKPTKLLSEEIYQIIDKEKDDAKSKVVEWYNENVDPFHNGLFTTPNETSSLSSVLDKCFTKLPVDLSPLFNLFNSNNFSEFLRGNFLDRLIITLLNEEDNRISPISTKKRVLVLLEKILFFPDRTGKVRLRLAIQPILLWIDQVYETEAHPSSEEEYRNLFAEIKGFFLKCWRITEQTQKTIVQVNRILFSLSLPSLIYSLIIISIVEHGVLHR